MVFDAGGRPARGSLFFARPKKSNQKKGRPDVSPFGFPALLAQNGVSPTGRPCPDGERRAIHGAPPAGLSVLSCATRRAKGDESQRQLACRHRGGGVRCAHAAWGK
ncbi:MAG: hypothetical protein CVV05_11275 [Gammaproteobacteria bacterium HGW-Gammaproteobacteria-1]|nr:MAG: hypothetical protein CVV05_11275 [Gammaproteobacteria bacterium HGW-Gammaproteobacteria-1]